MIPSGKARVAGVIGWPVAHSLSPRLHGFWLEQYRIDGCYIPLAVRPEALPDVLPRLPALGLRGANLTLPHKEASLGFCDHVDDSARRIGAVNTLVFEDSRIRGSNSDIFGFKENLVLGAPAFRVDAGPAVVLGAGGAARAVIAALQDLGVPEVRLVNRTLGRAEAIATQLGGAIRPLGWQQLGAVLADASLLVNTTSLGMTGQPPLDVDVTGLPDGAVVTDIVYTPLETPLLAAARARGLVTVDGLGMLLHQARPGFEAWFGVSPEVTPSLRDFVLAPPT